MTKPNDARLPLAGANLSGADLTYTKLEGAILTDAILPDILRGANLSGADLTDAIFPPPPVPDQIPQDLAEKLIKYGWHKDPEAFRLVDLHVTTVTIYGEDSPNTAESLSLIENYWGTVAAKRDKDWKEFFDNLPHR